MAKSVKAVAMPGLNHWIGDRNHLHLTEFYILLLKFYFIEV